MTFARTRGRGVPSTVRYPRAAFGPAAAGGGRVVGAIAVSRRHDHVAGRAVVHPPAAREMGRRPEHQRAGPVVSPEGGPARVRRRVAVARGRRAGRGRADHRLERGGVLRGGRGGRVRGVPAGAVGVGAAGGRRAAAHLPARPAPPRHRDVRAGAIPAGLHGRRPRRVPGSPRPRAVRAGGRGRRAALARLCAGANALIRPPANETPLARAPSSWG
jgi:hypothetical protein